MSMAAFPPLPVVETKSVSPTSGATPTDKVTKAQLQILSEIECELQLLFKSTWLSWTVNYYIATGQECDKLKMWNFVKNLPNEKDGSPISKDEIKKIVQGLDLGDWESHLYDEQIEDIYKIFVKHKKTIDSIV